nr:hypothetical protein [Marinicella sp. W31]MDC2877019.1 hypothetical protein [Marinicella sp. W31]
MTIPDFQSLMLPVLSLVTDSGAKQPAGVAMSVTDPRPAGLNENREHHKMGGHYCVQP